MKPHLDTYFILASLTAALIFGAYFGAVEDKKLAERIDALEEANTSSQPCDVFVRTDTLVYITDHLTTWQELILAIAYTESRFNPQAVGEAHDSGVLQLTPIYIREVNRVAGTSYALADAFDIEKAVEIFSRMQEHYNPEHDVEKAIRLHNRSPYYRREVLKNLEFIKQMEDVREAVKK